MMDALAGPSDPSRGCLTSIRSAPPVIAARASDAERTLTNNCVMVRFGHFDREKAHPPGIGAKRHWFGSLKHEAIQYGRVEPRGILEMAVLVGGERLAVRKE